MSRRKIIQDAFERILEQFPTDANVNPQAPPTLYFGFDFKNGRVFQGASELNSVEFTDCINGVGREPV